MALTPRSSRRRCGSAAQRTAITRQKHSTVGRLAPLALALLLLSAIPSAVQAQQTGFAGAAAGIRFAEHVDATTAAGLVFQDIPTQSVTATAAASLIFQGSETTAGAFTASVPIGVIFQNDTEFAPRWIEYAASELTSVGFDTRAPMSIDQVTDTIYGQPPFVLGPQVAVSRDGSLVAFVLQTGEQHGDDGLYVSRSDGTGLVRVSGAALSVRWCCWNSLQLTFTDKLAFVACPLGVDCFRSIGDVYVVNSDGSNLTRLTFDGGLDPVYGPFYGTPVVSLDGTTIAFLKWRDYLRLVIVNADGTGGRELPAPPAGQWFQLLSFSPDGSKLAFSDGVGIKTINIDGTGLSAFHASISPYAVLSGDWTTAVYVDSAGQLVSARTDDGVPRVLDSAPYQVPPSITDDGSLVAYTRLLGPNLNVFVVNSDGTNWRQVGDTRGTDSSGSFLHTYSPTVAPDGSGIAFLSSDDLESGRNQDFTTEVFFASLRPGSGPALTSIAPSLGPVTGGTSVTITGTGFASGATVSFGGSPATSAVLVNATAISAVTPAHIEGFVDVTVTNPDGQSGTLPSGFVYGVPAPVVEYVFRHSTGGSAFPQGAVVPFTASAFDPNTNDAPVTPSSMVVRIRVTDSNGANIYGPALLDFSTVTGQFTGVLHSSGLALGRYDATFTFVRPDGVVLATRNASFEVPRVCRRAVSVTAVSVR